MSAAAEWPVRRGWNGDVAPKHELVRAIDKLNPAELRRVLAYAAQNIHDTQGAAALTKLCPEFFDTWSWPGKRR